LVGYQNPQQFIRKAIIATHQQPTANGAAASPATILLEKALL
jgi:hypothetical protein